ncbi:hypothetical protein G9A89_020378 [Geosiphon pyriformis]|nr:hypothetical protein G9A89_020378 [Geosiphon pyriformis]
MCNVHGLNNPAKQNDVIHWHKDMNNLVFIFTKSKLKGRVHPWLADKFDGVRVFTSGLDSGSLGAGVMIVVNSSLAKYVCKVSEVPGWLLSIRLLFKNKFSVSILGLYAGASLVVWFFQAGKINSLIAKAINESFFVILGGDFNEDGSWKCISFKKCLELGLVNSLIGSLAVRLPTWANSKGVMKTINYVFVSPNLVNFLVHYGVSDVGNYFNTDHQAVSIFMGLGGLLNTHLFSLRKQVNKNCWKFDVKNASEAKWLEFKDAMAANTTMFSDAFSDAVKFSDLDTMWDIICKIMILSAGDNLDSAGASSVKSMFYSGVKFDDIYSALAKAKRLYCSLKLLKSKHAEKSHIRQTINNKIKSFELDKSHTIRSVLEHPFRKMVLDHLVMNNELVLKPDLVKSKINAIMKGWTRKRMVVDNISDTWSCQYRPLNYIFDDAFSGVISEIDVDELHCVVSSLPDRKAVGLSGISNELWKHCDKLVLGLLLVLLNSCLSCELKDILTNTCPIVLIETACKILSKILSDRISLACSSYNVLHDNNFSVLKGTTTQSLIFAVGSDMQKAYNLVGWEHLERSLVSIKMCSKFVHFFGSIYKDQTNYVMTNFGLTNSYQVFDGLDQEECQESVCGYRLNSYFVSRSGCTESQAGLSFFFTAGAFAATQYILNIASEFFRVNNISINNDKTVAIPINCRVSVLSLFISGSPISVVCRGEFHQYLSIFLSTEGLSKPNLAKAYSNIHFFTNLVLRKVFGYIPVGVCNKWNVLICRGLKLKAGLLLDFSMALLISFVNSGGILGHLFIHILLDCNLSLGGSLTSAFQFCDGVFMSVVLDKSLFFKFLPSLWYFGIAFRLNSRGPVPDWFEPSVAFFAAFYSSSTASVGVGPLNFCESDDFVSTHDRLSQVNIDSLSVYTDNSLRNLGTVDCRTEAAVFFENIDLGVSVSVQDLVSSTLMELQAIALALEYMPAAHSVNLFSDSQAALDAFKDHSGVSENDHADSIADAAFLSGWYLPPYVDGHFLLVDGGVVSGNFRHFVRDVCCVHWKVGSGSGFLASSLYSDVDWLSFSRVWHSDLHMATAFYKGFVFNGWLQEAVTVFHNPKIAGVKITDFVHSICSAFRNNIWLICAKHCAIMEKNGLIPVDGSFVIPVSGLVLKFSTGVVKLLGVTEVFGVLFGFCNVVLTGSSGWSRVVKCMIYA